ncbi:MAG: alkaline phosphatase family protein [Thermoleophilia bacterium]
MGDGKQKLMILGFDGTSPDLLERWMQEGHLPAIKKLVENGAYGPLESVPSMSSAPAWTSFATGKNPGKHGILSFTERNHDSYRYLYVNGTHRRAETFWKMLCGEHVGCIVNVPMTYPAETINGGMISGLDAPGADSPGICQPESLMRDMVAANGLYRVTANLTSILRRSGRWDDGADRLLDTMEMRYHHIEYLMDRFDWEIFTVVFGETDNVHHFYWKFIDANHPAYNAEETKLYGGVVLDVYRKMDEIVGHLVEKNPDATVLIVSDHGGAVNTRGAEALTDWLHGMDLMTDKKATSYDPRHLARRAFDQMAGIGYRLGNKYLSGPTRLKIARRFPGLSGKVESAVRLGNVDWSRTRAFCDGAQDDIWINLEGRDPLGTVPASGYDELCDFIVSELKDAVDIKTGEPVVGRVWRREEAYEGDYVKLAADICIRWKTEAVINGIRTRSSPPGRPALHYDWPIETPSGGHRFEGVLIANGPRIASGTIVRGARLMDVAPTVLYFFGEEVPEDFDGKVIEGIFEPAHLKANPPRYGGAARQAAAQEDIYSEEDSEVIEQRLRDLGYI